MMKGPGQKLTAGEDEGARVGIHGEVVQLKLALSIDGEPKRNKK